MFLREVHFLIQEIEINNMLGDRLNSRSNLSNKWHGYFMWGCGGTNEYREFSLTYLLDTHGYGSCSNLVLSIKRVQGCTFTDIGVGK